jgi:integrase
MGEFRTLKWNEVKRETYEDDYNTVRLILNLNGKTGIREVVCNKGTEVFFEGLYDYRKEKLNAHSTPDTFVCCHQDCTPIGSMRKAFDSMLGDLNLKIILWVKVELFIHSATCTRPLD